MNSVNILPYLSYNETEILELYKSVGWSNYYENPTMLKEAFANSLCILGAYYENKLIGIIRVVGDGHSIIYIQDLLVLTEYQHKKIGTMLLSAILNQYENVYQKILMTDNTEKTNSFYKSLGFIDLDKIGCVAFQHFNKSK